MIIEGTAKELGFVPAWVARQAAQDHIREAEISCMNAMDILVKAEVNYAEARRRLREVVEAAG